MTMNFGTGGSAGAFFLAAAAFAMMPTSAVAAPATAGTQQQTDDLSTRLSSLEAFIDGVMAEQIAAREVAGAVVTVVKDGQVLFTRGYGYADIDTGRRVDPARTLFRPGSVSKLFTWTALMQQVERGKVDLDADVNRYIDFKIPPYEGKPIRVRDLMQHSVGMSDSSGIFVYDTSRIVPYRDWIKAHVPQRLWAPGTEISYSNWGVALAGYIVERVSGEPFADYVENHIFKPLEMNATTFREPLTGAMKENMATGYKLVDGRFVAQPYELISRVAPAGSSAATAPDMARYMLAMLGGGALASARILKPESVSTLFSDSHANTPGLPGMAHGFFVYRKEGPRLVAHGGNTGDFHSNLVLAPGRNFGFFVSTSGGEGSSVGRTELSDAIIGHLFPQERAPRWTGTDTPPPPAGAYRGNRRDYSEPADPKHDLKIEVPAPDRLIIRTSEAATAWDRIGPRLYEKVTGARDGGPFDRLEFYGPADAPRLSFSYQPYMNYHFVVP